MNFKTPFKVLTTAALIGTLSLSAVAPGVASAAEPTQLAEGQASNFEIKTVILEKDSQLVELSFNDYALLVAGDQAAANGYEVKYIVADNGEVFAFDTYALASSEATNQTANEVLKALSEKEQTTTAPENIKKGEFDEDGKLVAAEEQSADKTELTKAIEEAKAVEAKDEETAKALEEAVKAAEEVVAKEDATAEEIKAVLDALTEAVTAATPVVVESVTAITQTIASGTATELEFEVNGEKYTKTTFDKKFKDAGYEVSFKTDQDASPVAANGKATASKDFKYAVQVTDKDGKEVNEVTEDSFVTVTVKSSAVEKVTAAVLNNKLAYTTVDATDVDFVATAATTGLGKEATAEQLSALEVESAESDNLAVATYEPGKGIVAKKEGTATFTVQFKGIKDPVEVTVEVKAKTAASSIEAADQKIIKGNNFDKTAVKVLDQHGQKFTITEGTAAGNLKYAVVDSKGEAVADITQAAAGTYTVKVLVVVQKADGTEDKQIGSFKVEVADVDTATVTPDKYELSFDKANDKELNTIDLNPDAKVEAKAAVVNVKGSYQGFDLTDFNEKLEASTNNEGVTAVYAAGKINITVTDATKVAADDTVKVTLKSVKGDLKTTKATIDVKIVNTTPQIETLSLEKANATAIEGTKATTEALANKVDAVKVSDLDAQLIAKDADGKDIFVAAKQVTKVEFENRKVDTTKKEVTGKVTVTLGAAYGGKSFTFDGSVKFDKTNVEDFLATGEYKGTTSITVKQSDFDASVATIDGKNKVTIEDGIKTPANATLTTIKNSKITGLVDGDNSEKAGIYAKTNLTLENVTVDAANAAAGVMVAGNGVKATITNSVINVSNDTRASYGVYANAGTTIALDGVKLNVTTTTDKATNAIGAESAGSQLATVTFAGTNTTTAKYAATYIDLSNSVTEFATIDTVKDAQTAFGKEARVAQLQDNDFTILPAPTK